MKNKHKNQIYELIEKSGFNPQDFILVDQLDDWQASYTHLQLKDSLFICQIYNKETFELFSVYYVSYAPGFPLLTTDPYDDTVPNIDWLLSVLEKWLVEIALYQEDQKVPDFWKMNFSNILNSYPKSEENKPATLEHKQIIVGRLMEVEKLLAGNKDLILINVGQEILFEEIQELKKKIDSPDITYKDIKMTVLGTIMSWVTDKLIDIKVAGSLAEFLLVGRKEIYDFLKSLTR